MTKRTLADWLEAHIGTPTWTSAGFVKADLPNHVRLYVWPDKGATEIHAHRHPLTCIMLLGTLVHRKYRWDPAPGRALAIVPSMPLLRRYAITSKGLRATRDCGVAEIAGGRQVHGPRFAARFTIRAGTYHRLEPLGPAAVIVARGPLEVRVPSVLLPEPLPPALEPPNRIAEPLKVIGRAFAHRTMDPWHASWALQRLGAKRPTAH